MGAWEYAWPVKTAAAVVKDFPGVKCRKRRDFDQLKPRVVYRALDACVLQISSASNCTDYQSRRLGITYRTQHGDIKHCHTVSTYHLLYCCCVITFDRT